MNVPDLTKLTEDQLQRVIPEMLKYILGGADGYSDGIDEILEWELDNGIATGKFLDRAPAGDRIFEFELNCKTGEYSFIPISGVED